MLLATIDELRFDEEELDELSWSPIVYTYLLGAGLFSLVSREFAPLEQRLASARGSDGGHPGRPRCRPRQPDIRPRPAGRRLPRREGDRDDARRGGPVPHGGRDGRRGGRRDPRARERRGRTGDRLRSRRSRGGCPTTCCHPSTATSAWGATCTSASSRILKATITPDDLEQRAATAYDEVRAEMLTLARELWPDWVGDEPMPDDGDALTRRVLDVIAVDHPKPDELLDFCPAEHERIVAFIRERDLIGLPDDPLQIIWTPPLPAGLRRRRCSSHPGRSTRASTASSPSPRRPTRGAIEQVESMLRENNGRSPQGPYHPRGGAGPLPPAGLVEPMRVAALVPSSARGSSSRAGRCT